MSPDDDAQKNETRGLFLSSLFANFQTKSTHIGFLTDSCLGSLTKKRMGRLVKFVLRKGFKTKYSKLLWIFKKGQTTCFLNLLEVFKALAESPCEILVEAHTID